jgi:AcrR family transcriptional regulator
MQNDRSEGSDEAVAGTPSGELERLRREEAAAEKQRCCRMQRAALEAAGEVGYRELAVRHVLARSGEHRSGFYRHFDGKADCYARAYESGSKRLGDRLLEVATQQPSWRDGLRSALDELAAFLEREPMLARGLLAEVYVAGKPAMAKRNEVFERLSRAIDCARRENESRHSPPPIAADFILSAIETSAINALNGPAPTRFAAAVPELAHLATAVFFGQPPDGDLSAGAS